MVRVARGVLVVLLGLAACGDDGTAQPPDTTAESTTTTAEPTTTTDPPPDPSVIPEDPADIDEEYIEAVLAELFHLDGEILRIARRDGASPELGERILAVYSGSEGATQLNFLTEAIASGFEGFADNPGDVTATVTAVIAASPTCVSVDTVQDATAVGPNGRPDAALRVELRPSLAPGPLNPTAWVIVLMHPLEAAEAPAPCAD